jgi:lysophospholipase L1-like esterase
MIFKTGNGQGIWHEEVPFYRAVVTTQGDGAGGVYHPSGAYRIGVYEASQGFYTPWGAINVRDNGDGTYSPAWMGGEAVTPEIPALSAVAHNLTVGNMATFRAAMEEVRTGTGRCRVIIVGDSTTANGYPNDGLTSKQNSWPMKMGKKLDESYVSASHYNWFGANGYTLSADYEEFYPNLNFSGTWSNGASVSYGGFNWACNGAGPFIEWTIEVPTDTIEIYYITSAGLGTWNYQLDGGATTPVVATGVNSLQKITLNTTLGMHVVRINGVTGSCGLSGMAAFNSTEAGVDIYNGGWRGSTSGDWNVTTNPWSSRNWINFLAPDLTIINLGINDWRDNVLAASDYETNIQAFITEAKETGDCVIQLPFPSATTGSANNFASQAVQDSFRAYLLSLAESNDCPYIDTQELFGSHAQASIDGYVTDALHSNTPGYDLIADQFVSLLLNAEVGNISGD